MIVCPNIQFQLAALYMTLFTRCKKVNLLFSFRSKSGDSQKCKTTYQHTLVIMLLKLIKN